MTAPEILADQLETAADLIDVQGWARLGWYRSTRDPVTREKRAPDESPLDVVGAIHVACGCAPDDHAPCSNCRAAAEAVVEFLELSVDVVTSPRVNPVREALGDWNDETYRTKHDVTTALRDTAASLRAKAVA